MPEIFGAVALFRGILAASAARVIGAKTSARPIS
jgi:hypothetical protein